MNKNHIWQPEQREVKRSELSFADYNPRFITDEARKQLKRNLKKVGLLGGIVWNEKTGNLVSGHQRLSVLDEVNHYDPDNVEETDYMLRVEVVDLDMTAEIEQNLFMNNTNVQGETDNEALRFLKQNYLDVDLHAAGFSDMELQFMGIEDIDNEDIGLDDNENVIDDVIEDTFIQNQKAKQAVAYTNKDSQGKEWSMDDFEGDADAQEADRQSREMGETRMNRDTNFYDADQQEQIARHNEIRKIKERINNKASDDNDGGMFSYLVLKFERPTQRAAFLEMMGYEDLTLSQVDGLELHRKIELGE